ncbi:hypothetical protein ISN44_As04g004750 [Arabidopsis suecica]|uniref:Uncharacterized protein n=1 Tax=Arabidopsis suecica TaxID=45249 RepID=A0A8T2EBT1_ARASU|nr:hypothetical protein ISN44_As04g004750 [Arabidopsis suecica]
MGLGRTRIADEERRRVAEDRGRGRGRAREGEGDDDHELLVSFRALYNSGPVVVLTKILMSVSMRCDKCRSEALKIGAKTTGVTFVGIEGEEKDKVVVIGEGVDAACLVVRLRKKVGFADIISVTDVDDT